MSTLANPQADPGGLMSAEAQRRLGECGPNELRRESKTTPFGLLARQFANPVVWLLLGASILSAALGERLDAIALADDSNPAPYVGKAADTP